MLVESGKLKKAICMIAFSRKTALTLRDILSLSQDWQEAIQDITEYIEIFYNRQRRQAKLGFLSPVTYEQRFYAGLLAA